MSEQKQARLREEVDRLITTINKGANESLRQQIHSHANRIFLLPLNRAQQDPIVLRQKITARVSGYSNSQNVVALQDLMHRFMNNSAIYKKAQVLKMLLKLSELSSAEQGVKSLFRQPRKRELAASLQTNISNISTLPQQRRTSASIQTLRAVRNRGSVQDSLSQGDLVRQLIFALDNGVSNDIIETKDGYELRPGLAVTDPVRKIVSQMSDLGWLLKKIKKQCEKQGTVGKALKLAVNAQLTHYNSWLAQMQGYAKDGRLTLRKFIRWSYMPTLIIKWLAIVLQSVAAFQGGDIISIINSYRPQGNIQVQSLLDRLLSSLLQPLINYVNNWVYSGELIDPRGEFFITENKKVSESSEWEMRFKLQLENVPTVISPESARKIFIAGKSIYFLRNRCKVVYSIKAALPEGKNRQLGQIFEEWLEETHREAGSALVEVLKGQFHLKYHLLSMKHFFLCGKGDFIQHLYDNLREKLNREKHEITQHSLDGYLQDAVTKCFTDFKLPDGENYRSSILDRLLAKKVQFGFATRGWDCFNLQYSLQRLQPMVPLLSPQIIMNYQKIFNFLWKVKQIQQMLKEIWLLHSKDEALRTRRAKVEEVGELFMLCYLLRNTMNHFLTNLHGYIMVSIESSWDKFWQALDKSSSFDHILQLHKQFQQEILQITLNTPKHKHILTALYTLFDVISKFRNVFMDLQKIFEDYYNQLVLYENRQLMARKGYEIEPLIQLPQFDSRNLSKQIKDIRAAFDIAFKQFFTQLKKDSQNKLSVLSFKLDYSEYYTNLYSE